MPGCDQLTSQTRRLDSGILELPGYCGVNVCFNTLGLYLTKHGSAVLNALSYSMLLPFTTALFFTPLLGPYQEPLTRDAYSQNVGEAPRRVDTPILSPTPTCPSGALLEEFLERPPSAPSIGQPSFQERVVGMAPVRKNSAGEIPERLI
eukprot:g7364.t1